jgi:transcriptional regulator with XRE-family HTH domain
MAGKQNNRNGHTNKNGTNPRTVAAPSPPLHRLVEVRRREGISRRAVARRLGIGIAEVKRQEETSDLPLSTLYEWQKVLKVPFAEILGDPADSLSPPLRQRGQLVRLMKTAMTIMQQAKRSSIKRMAETLVAQLTEIMPELREVNPWPKVGKQRQRNECGQTAHRSLPDKMFVKSTRDEDE